MPPTDPLPDDPRDTPLPFLSGGGTMGELARGHDWGTTPLGPPRQWPQSLRSVLSACLNSPMLGAVLWGPDLLMLYNDAYIPSLADRHPAAFGRPVADVWGDAWAMVAPPFHHAMATGEGFERRGVELRILRNGRMEATWWNFTATPIRGEDGSVAGLLNQGVEISDQVRAEDELRAANARLARSVEERTEHLAVRTSERDRLWDLSQDIMLRCGFDGCIQAVNPAWFTVLGWREDELVGRNLFELIHPDDMARTAQGASELSDGGSHVRFDNRYRHRDGSYRWISWSTRSADQSIFAVGRDFTAEREREHALRDAEEALRQSQKLEAVGQLTGGVAHDFNNLLAVIRTSIDLLRLGSLPEDRRARFLESISNAVDRGAKLTAQLLAFARRQALKPVAFDVIANVRQVCEMVGTLMGARVAVDVEVGERVLIVQADPGQFDTAIVNMAVNARDAMNGAGRLRIALRPVEQIPAVRSHPAVPGRFVAVSLTDTGTGIEADRLAHVFEPFYTTKEVGAGTGLGLSQVFGFAKQSGGDVHVQSTVGEGTTFTLYLPRAASASESVKQDSSNRALEPGRGARVLVVEDNPDVAITHEAVLSELGYAPVVVHNASDALAELATDAARFAVVFSDVVMAGMNGIELAKEIERLHPELPVVLTSGYSDVLAGADAQRFDLLPKPYSLDALDRMLTRAIAG